MNEVFEKIIERFEIEKKKADIRGGYTGDGMCSAFIEAIEIVQEVAEEYQKDNKETITKLISGEWVDCDEVQEALGMSFKECFPLFDFSRTAEWWCLAGKTKEEKNRNGQKITTKFKLKSNDDGWIPCKYKIPPELLKVMVITDKKCYYIARINTKGKWVCLAELMATEIEMSNVIAWRYLPEPYKERESNE